MKKGLIVSMLASTLLLVGCQSSGETEASPNESVSTSVSESEAEERTTQTTSQSTSSSSTSESTTSSTSETEERLWNDNKAQSLDAFMAEWGETMDQKYEEYSEGNNVDWYGTQIPDALVGEGKDWTTMLDEEPVNFEWSEDGEATEGNYALVAVYSDADIQEYLEQHLYFFTIHEGEPKVLVSKQNQGNAENNFYFWETDNPQLKDGFSDIVNGE